MASGGLYFSIYITVYSPLGHCRLVDMSSAYSAKGQGFTTQWRQEFIIINCIFCSFEKIKLQLGPTFKKNSLQSLLIIFVYWTQLLKYWTHETKYIPVLNCLQTLPSALFCQLLPFPPLQLPPIARPEPLTVPDFPPPFYSVQQQPPLLPPPVQDSSVNVLQLIRSIESQQQLELEELQGILQLLKNRSLQHTVKIHQHIEQTKTNYTGHNSWSTEHTWPNTFRY